MTTLQTLSSSIWQTPWIGLAILSALCGLSVVLATFILQMFLERRRLKRFHDLELIPNILLTTYPILFIGRHRSLFRLSGDFLELPIYLKEHGYQVEEVELLTRGMNQASIITSISSLLNAPPHRDRMENGQAKTVTKHKVHLFLSQAFTDAAHDLAFDGHPCLASLTVIGDRSHGLKMDRLHLRPPRVPLHVRPDLKPQIAKFDFQTERSTLDHLVSLAESDLR